MTNEENYLSNKMGKKNPFTVPEGYFEQLTERVMNRIPEQKKAKTAVFKRLRPWLYAAACVCVGVFVAAMVFNNKTDVESQQQTAVSTQDANYGYYSDTYIEEEADYAMIDSQEIYACLLAEM